MASGSLSLEVREDHEDYNKVGYVNRTSQWHNLQCFGFIAPSQDPHPAHFPEARNSDRGKDYGVDNPLPSTVVFKTLIFIYRALYAASQSRYVY